MQTDHMVDAADRHIGWAEQIVLAGRVREQKIDAVGGDLGLAGHEGQPVVDRCNGHDFPAACAQRRQLRQQVERYIRVAAQAEFGPAIDDARRHHLCNDIDLLENLAHHMGVVGAEVMLLRMLAVQIGAGIQEKFNHFDIGRHAPRAMVRAVHAQGRNIIQFGIIAKHARDKGFEKTPFKIVRPRRPA